MKGYNKSNIPIAKTLRKNMTLWERKLWYEFLRYYHIRFQRQKAIGNYILIDRTGILGAPLSTVASYAVSLLISLIALRSCGVRMRIVKRCVPELLAGFVFFGLPYTFVYSRGQISVVSVFLCLAISSIAYFGMVFVRSILTFKNVNNAQKLKCNIGYTYEIDK